MTRKNFFSFLTSLKSNVTQSLKLQKHPEPKYRLVNWLGRERFGEEGYCQIEVVETARRLNYSPREIIENDELLTGFSPKEASVITNLFHLKANKPRVKMLSVLFSDHKSIKFQKLDGSEIQIPFNDLRVGKKDIIRQLSIIDAFRVGMIVGEEAAQVGEF